MIGLGLSLLLAIIALSLGTIIGVIGGFLTTSKSKLIKLVIRIYIAFIRNSPLLILILIAYFGLPSWGIRLGKIEAFLWTLTIYSGAYLIEVFRAGLDSIPIKYVESGKAIGLNNFQIAWYIKLPLMFRISLPSLGNNIVSLFKDTSLAAAIAVPELTFYARQINVRTFRVIETWLVASIMYVITCVVIAFLIRQVEKKYSIIK